MAPMVDVIRLVDTEEKPSMGYIYKAMDICKEKASCQKIFEEESKILAELVPCRTRRGRLGRANAIASIQSIAPVEWWITFGSEIPNLQKFAKRVLGLTTSASPCERKWNAFNNLHTKKRNRLDHAKLNDLVHVQYNKRLRKRFEERVMGSEVDPIVLKPMEECQEWLDPHDARDDPVEGTDFTYGILEDAEGSENDEHPPPLTRQQTYKRRRTNTNATSQPESSSRETTTSAKTTTRARARSSQVQLDDSETDEDEDIFLTTDDEDFNDGISSRDEEDLWGN
ncbi:uncharacterized protein LOC113326443 [Papaver somniferum]|uniref:uncharacterized protein LOC113326443 n=1 Tax=Papaver somniferum TaxID=3469 RepID=UPI000E705745|nr:uncharacterized protein LOC113326443 [Papaver somniferum]